MLAQDAIYSKNTEDIKSAQRMGAQLIIQIYKNRCTVNSSLK
jgi:hypothetical protein